MPRPVLIGPPGAGKSTVARILADRHGWPLGDSDELAETRSGSPVADLFVAEDGERRFRDLEADCVAALLEDHRAVIAVGSGALDSAEHGERVTGALKDSGRPVILLEVSMPVAAKRLGFNASVSAFGNPRAEWAAMLRRRMPRYRAAATTSIQTDELDPEAVADQVTALLGPV